MAVSEFIKTLGGSTRVARNLGVPVQTVHSWTKAERIPAWRMDAIAELARANGVELPKQ